MDFISQHSIFVLAVLQLVTPAQAGVHLEASALFQAWTPACAGVTI